MFAYDALVYIALLILVIGVGYAGWVIIRTPETDSLEHSKVRFAAATFTGILLLIVFTAVLYFVNPDGPGKEIFEKVFTALTPITGGIIGYLFATTKN